MYGKGAGALNVATGVAILPNTGSNRTLFTIAASLLVLGVAILIASTIMTRKSHKAKSN
jgi:LPXTG-motif cell wall-anchored protein